MTQTTKRQPAPAGHVSTRVPVLADDGQLIIDPWWGEIQPMQLHPQLRAVGELEVIDHIAAGGVLVDTRQPEYVRDSGLIANAILSPWQDIVDTFERLESDGKITRDSDIVLYCNGPQCAATPRAVELLQKHGWPMGKLLYYRGGIMDWMSLGLPVTQLDR